MQTDGSVIQESIVDPDQLRRFCREITFKAGETLRLEGHFYAYMFVLTEGEVEIAFRTTSQKEKPIVRGAGSPVGEISFLTGRPAIATVTARTACRALRIDDPIWATIEKQETLFAAELYQQLADIAEGRESFNLSYLPDSDQKPSAGKIDLRLCRDADTLLEAQRLRYEVYCGELGRSSPFADHDKKIIADDLDSFGLVLLALENGKPIGTLRSNVAREGDLGVLQQLYGMTSSDFHPEHTSVCTKFIVRKSSRNTQASFQLMLAAIEYAERENIRECFIDCIPSLLPFYKVLGFQDCGPAFLHRENGRSLPLKLDIQRYGKRIKKVAGFSLG